MQGEKLPVGSAATIYWQQFIQDDPQMCKTEDIYTDSRFGLYILLYFFTRDEIKLF